MTKTIVVTGATSGIGEATALALAEAGHRVGIVARNPAKAAATRERILDETPGASVDVFGADLSLDADVRRAAAEIAAAYGRLDVLVNNAGIHNSSLRRTADGEDEMLAVNTKAPFVLSALLVPALATAAPARIVTVASEAHRLPPRLSDDPIGSLEPYQRGVLVNNAYGRSKLAVILLMHALAERLADRRISVVSVCPGLVATHLQGEGNFMDRAGRLLANTPLLRTPAQGARVSVRMATAPDVEGRTGIFVSSTPGAGLLPQRPELRDKRLQAELFDAACARWHVSI